jgi:hypothetical protein
MDAFHAEMDAARTYLVPIKWIFSKHGIDFYFGIQPIHNWVPPIETTPFRSEISGSCYHLLAVFLLNGIGRGRDFPALGSCSRGYTLLACWNGGST